MSARCRCPCLSGARAEARNRDHDALTTPMPSSLSEGCFRGTLPAPSPVTEQMPVWKMPGSCHNFSSQHFLPGVDVFADEIPCFPLLKVGGFVPAPWPLRNRRRSWHRAYLLCLPGASWCPQPPGSCLQGAPSSCRTGLQEQVVGRCLALPPGSSAGSTHWVMLQHPSPRAESGPSPGQQGHVSDWPRQRLGPTRARGQPCCAGQLPGWCSSPCQQP